MNTWLLEIRGGVSGAEVWTTDKPNWGPRWQMKGWFQAKILPEGANFRRAIAGDSDSLMLR